MALSAVTLIVAIPVLTVAIIRPLMFTSAFISETVFVATLWVFWLSTAATASYQFSDLNDIVCDGFDGFPQNSFSSYCHKAKVLQAFSWLIWVILTAYAVVMVFALLANQNSTKGNNNGSSSTREDQSFTPHVALSPMMHTPQYNTNTANYSSRVTVQPSISPRIRALRHVKRPIQTSIDPTMLKSQGSVHLSPSSQHTVSPMIHPPRNINNANIDLWTGYYFAPSNNLRTMRRQQLQPRLSKHRWTDDAYAT
jgi:hypothetical protein